MATINPASNRRWLFQALSFIACVLGSSAVVTANLHVTVNTDRAVTPHGQREGWSGDDGVGDVFADLPTFQVVGSNGYGDSEGAKVFLWEFAQQVNGGKHLPTYRQETGDCVSMGAANAINYLQTTQIARDRQNAEFRGAFQP